jgi:hypothetical protein
MALTSPPDKNSNDDGYGERDLAGATALLASLAPRIRAVLAHSPLRVPLGRLAVMQPDPTRAHVLYLEPDLRSPDGRRLRAVCGALRFRFRLGSLYLSLFLAFSLFFPPPGDQFRGMPNLM